MKLLNFFLFCIFISSTSISLQASQSNGVTRILYINSYHRGFSWSDDIERGMNEVLKKSNAKYELSTEYLDSKRFNYKLIQSALVSAMKKKYGLYKPDLVLVSDNNAFEFVKHNRENLFPGIPLVFSGFNNFSKSSTKGMYQVTGINEKIDLAALTKMAIDIHPKTKAIAFVVSDNNASSKKIYNTSQDVFKSLKKQYQVEVLFNKTQREISKILTQLPKETIVILAGETANLGPGRTLSPSEHGKLVVNASPFPTYSSWQFHVDNGATGGHILSGYAQGTTMANMALQIISGIEADQIPVVMATPAQDIFRYDKLLAFDISIAQLPANSIVLDKPEGLWDKYKYQIVLVLVLILLQMAFIFILLINIEKRKQALKNLDVERSTLEFRVMERTSELNDANKKLEQMSLEDSLTGLKNRRFLDTTLEQEIDSLQHNKHCLSLIMVDIDFFKQYNDIYGHIKGDNCLQNISSILKKAITRTKDTVARYGGEEFMIVLPNTDQAGAKRVADNIKQTIKLKDITHSDSPFNQQLTVSIGVISIHADADIPLSSASLLTLVDSQLYKAKGDGRNRICQSSFAPVDNLYASPKVTNINQRIT